MTRQQWLEAYKQDSLSAFEQALGDLAQARYALNQLTLAVQTAIDLDDSPHSDYHLRGALREAKSTIDFLS